MSPLKPAVPFPATKVRMLVLASNRSTTWYWLLAIKTLPAGSIATPLTRPKLAEVPGIFTGNPPPAMVEIV